MTLSANQCPHRPPRESGEDAPSAFTGWRVCQFALLWLGLLVAIRVFLVPFVYNHFGDWICALEASHCSLLGRVFGLETSVSQNIVTTPSYYVRVEPVCTGVDYMLYLVGLTAFFPLRCKYRAIWILLLPTCLYALLVFRLFFLLLSGQWFPEWVPFLHETWKYGFAVFFTLIWIVFLVRQMRQSTSSLFHNEALS